MVELLLFTKLHWMDIPSVDRPDLTGLENVKRKANEEKITIEQRAKKLFLIDKKYEMRDRPNDIIEVRRDGAPGGKKERLAFAKIRVPMDYKVAKRAFEGADMDERVPGYPELKHKRRFWLDTTGLKLSYDDPVEITVEDFMMRLRAK